MRVRVKTDATRDVEVVDGADIDTLLDLLGMNRETVIVKKGGYICLEEEPLKDGDLVEIITVVSGG